MSTKIELPEEKSSTTTSSEVTVDQLTAQFDALVRVDDLDLQTLTINGVAYYALKKKAGLKNPSKKPIAPKKDVKIEPKKEAPPIGGRRGPVKKSGRAKKTGPFMLAGPPAAGGLPGMSTFSSPKSTGSDDLAFIHDAANTNISSPQSSSSLNPTSPSTSELSNIHNFDSVTSANDFDAFIENLEPSLRREDFVPFEEPQGDMKRHRDVFVAQNAIANGSNIVLHEIPDSPTQAAILQELNNPGPCCKKRRFDNPDDELISTMMTDDFSSFHSSENLLNGQQSNVSNPVQYADSSLVPPHEQYYYQIPDNIPHSAPQFENQNQQQIPEAQDDDVVLELNELTCPITEARNVFIKKDIWGQKNQKEKDQAAKVLIDANRVEEVKARENVNRGLDRQFQCILCPALGQKGRGFNNNEDLYRHHCQHLNYKPITCDTCGEGFYRRDHLNRHMQNQHSVSVKKRVRAPNGSTPNIPQRPLRRLNTILKLGLQQLQIPTIKRFADLNKEEKVKVRFIDSGITKTTSTKRLKEPLDPKLLDGSSCFEWISCKNNADFERAEIGDLVRIGNQGVIYESGMAPREMARNVEYLSKVKYPPLEAGKTYEGTILWNEKDFRRHIDKNDNAPHPLCRMRFKFKTPKGDSVQFVNVLQDENSHFPDPALPTSDEHYGMFPDDNYSNIILDKMANEMKKKTFKIEIIQREHLYGCDKHTRHWRGYSKELLALLEKYLRKIAKDTDPDSDWFFPANYVYENVPEKPKKKKRYSKEVQEKIDEVERFYVIATKSIRLKILKKDPPSPVINPALENPIVGSGSLFVLADQARQYMDNLLKELYNMKHRDKDTEKMVSSMKGYDVGRYSPTTNKLEDDVFIRKRKVDGVAKYYRNRLKIVD
ncbi:Oidioi.mRNA.OKI2018_I69.PAR.g12168.t1.cds [Oikopleura dioica]|uniref:Oidioi.mRNA.OKI2018_I69.PAR.g12168.t1.cds n=1 Tax=Oikopleura dioica TaxID=34765 RepID=A0ABN7RYW9_OIKDI|nr:Oidioi.mRNA.OKI2018_I69.PAR.g12168.t1.cds [Oikopleura dioica]